MARQDIRNQVYGALLEELSGRIGGINKRRLSRSSPEELEEQQRVARIEENEPFTLIGDPSEPPPLEGPAEETYFGKKGDNPEPAIGGEEGDGQVTCPQCGTRLSVPRGECSKCAESEGNTNPQSTFRY